MNRYTSRHDVDGLLPSHRPPSTVGRPRLRRTPAGSTVVLPLHGEIDVATAALLGPALADLIDPATSVVVDLGEVTFLDSVGLGVLVAAYKKARVVGGRLRLAGAQAGVLRVLRLTAVLPVLGGDRTVADELGVAS